MLIFDWLYDKIDINWLLVHAMNNRCIVENQSKHIFKSLAPERCDNNFKRVTTEYILLITFTASCEKEVIVGLGNDFVSSCKINQLPESKLTRIYVAILTLQGHDEVIQNLCKSFQHKFQLSNPILYRISGMRQLNSKHGNDVFISDRNKRNEVKSTTWYIYDLVYYCCMIW